DFSDCRSILRLCPKAACVNSDNSLMSQASGAGRGTSSTREEQTLGEGVNAVAGISNRMRALQRQFASTESRPYAARSKGVATIRSEPRGGTIKTSLSNQGGHGSVSSH